MTRKRRSTWHTLTLALAVIGLQGPPTRAEEIWRDKQWARVGGGQFRWPKDGACKAVVVIFIGYDCPISNAYSPEINRLCREFSPHGVQFLLVYADADLDMESAQRHATEYGFTCPTILDPQMTLVRWVGAKIKPEAAVLTPKGQLLYRGRINDLYPEVGKKRPRPTTHDLKDALQAVIEGKEIRVPRTRAVGCDIQIPDNKP